MKNLLCEVRGHEWKVWAWSARTGEWQARSCVRCHWPDSNLAIGDECNAIPGLHSELGPDYFNSPLHKSLFAWVQTKAPH